MPANKEAVGWARKLLQYCQLPERNSRDIFRDVWNNLGVFKHFIHFIYCFSHRQD
jgi:hypothetical protein